MAGVINSVPINFNLTDLSSKNYLVLKFGIQTLDYKGASWRILKKNFFFWRFKPLFGGLKSGWPILSQFYLPQLLCHFGKRGEKVWETFSVGKLALWSIRRTRFNLKWPANIQISKGKKVRVFFIRVLVPAKLHLFIFQLIKIFHIAKSTRENHATVPSDHLLSKGESPFIIFPDEESLEKRKTKRIH